MTTVTEIMVKCMSLELPDKLERYIERDIDTTCCITGKHITTGIPWKRVIPSSTGEYLDLMHGMAFKYMSLDAARAFKGSWNMGSRMLFSDGTGYHPYIASSSADKNDRTYWSALIRDVWPGRAGQECVIIITSDFKKKIWPQAKVGVLGNSTPVLLYDTDRMELRNLVINWESVISTLDIVEEVYTKGFTKRGIGEGLFSDYGAFSEDVARSLEYEELLQPLRALPEFAVSILIAQKREV